MRLCVLICTHNRADLLERVLASLNNAKRPSIPVHILVAANACSDDTVERMRTYQAQQFENGWLPLRLVEDPTPGKSHALNQAIPLIDAELVALVDDDHRVDNHYLTAIEHAVNIWPDAGLYCGRILPDWDGSEPAWVHDQGPYRVYPLPVPRFDLGDEPRELNPDIAIPGGGNLFLRGPWLKRVGQFAAELGPVGHNLGGAEDIDWVLRALAKGARLQYVPDVVQHHYVDNDRLKLRYLIAKAFERTASTVRVHQGGASGIPLYLYRKLFSYLLSAMTAWSNARRRFFLVRLAASLGEIKGYRQARKDGRTNNS